MKIDTSDFPGKWDQVTTFSWALRLYCQENLPSPKQANQKTNRKVTLCAFTNPFTRAGYDTRSIFKRILTSLNSEFSFSEISSQREITDPQSALLFTHSFGENRWIHIYADFLFWGIILWIELPWPENTARLCSSGEDHYTLLMRPNKVETAVQCFRMSRAGVRCIFLSW